MRWEACRVGGRYRRAFLVLGADPGGTAGAERPGPVPQLLVHRHEGRVRVGELPGVPYGGSIACRGGSVHHHRQASAEHAGVRHTTSTFFRFPVNRHHDSVQRFHAQDIRFEVRNPDVVVIDCVWDSGTVHFSDCDDTAFAHKDFSARSPPAPLHRGPARAADPLRLLPAGGPPPYRPASADLLPVVARYDMCLLRSHAARDFAVTSRNEPGPLRPVRHCIDAGTPSGASGPASPATPPPPPCLAPSPSPSPAPATAPRAEPRRRTRTAPGDDPRARTRGDPGATDAPTPRDAGHTDCASPQQKPP
ncbi:hypothetical protein LT493_12405 [Streptomyces tricolor]|nr:hypothetical protein [Streptomyces tricolor]